MAVSRKRKERKHDQHRVRYNGLGLTRKSIEHMCLDSFPQSTAKQKRLAP